MEELIDKLYEIRDLSDDELACVIGADDLISAEQASGKVLFQKAMMRRREYYGNRVYIRGLIEFTNYCKNQCYYCGLRASNSCIHRYRLSHDEILACTHTGYALGFRTFVLQGGEDPWFTDERMCEIVRDIHAAHPDCAITLSLGERTRGSYEALYEAGARRYLLRHETANDAHYAKLHPASMSLDNRKKCLFDLKSIGYQVGSGFMVGSPGQTVENLIADLRFLQQLEPDMIGIGPFLPQKETPFANETAGSLMRTVRLVAIMRLMFPYALIPSTTALATLDEHGREMGLLAGANVVMPNLSPLRCRADYAIYDNKASSGEEAAESRDKLAETLASLGLELVVDIGNVKK